MLTVDIIIPTYDNFNQLSQCVSSILATEAEHPVNIIIVNNGKIQIAKHLDPKIENIKIITTGENLGWIGGLREGIKHSHSKYVLFANDDIFIPRSSNAWLRMLVEEMEKDPRIGAIGPTSNVVSGKQNIWDFSPGRTSNYLIGFCKLLRREALDAAGGIHDMEVGGDDLDLSIRIRKAGYRLVVHREVFVYHHGFQTGEKVHGGPNKPNGWNSREMVENTAMELIRKHGFLEWWKTVLNRTEA